MANKKTAKKRTNKVSQVRERKPFPSEREFFYRNAVNRGVQGGPTIEGMAAEDNRVVMNPFSLLPAKERAAVKRNEQVRAALRKNDIKTSFSLTKEQKQRFQTYGAPKDQRHTIIARSLSGDPSAGKLTESQRAAIKKVKRQLGMQ